MNFSEKSDFWKIPHHYLWTWVCCGCAKPFFEKIFKSWRNLEDFPYLRRFHTINTSEDICAWNLPKIAFTAFIAKIRYFWCFWSTLSEMRAEVPKRAVDTPKFFLGVKWVHKTSGTKKANFLCICGRNSTSNMEIFDFSGLHKATKLPKFWPKLAEKQHLLKFFFNNLLVF